MLRKREGSLNEPKRRMRQSAKLSRRLHLDKLHQRKAPLIRLPTASLSTSARAWLDAPQSASGDREYTGKWVKWHGRWYQKVIRHGRTEWEESKPARCSRHCFCTIAAFLLVSLTAFWVVAVMAVYKAHATNPASLRWLT